MKERSVGRMRFAATAAVLALLLCLAPAFLPAQVVNVYKTHSDTAADDVFPGDPGADPPRWTRISGGEVEWQVDLVASLTRDIRDGVFEDDISLIDNCQDISPAQCSAIQVDGSCTPVTIDCSAGADTIEISNICIPRGVDSTVTITWRNDINTGSGSCTMGRSTCNRASFSHPGGGPFASRDPIATDPNGPSCISIGEAAGVPPDFLKDHGPDDEVWVIPATGERVTFRGGKIQWILTLVNSTAQDTEGALIEDLPDEQLIDCSFGNGGVEILLDGGAHPSPPSNIVCGPASFPELAVGRSPDDPLLIPPHSTVQVVFWTTVVSDPVGGQTCNQARYTLFNGPAVFSRPLGSVIEEPTCITVRQPLPFDIGLDKTSEDLNGWSLQPGDIVRYTVDVCSDVLGTVDVQNTMLRDTMPAWTNYVFGTITLDGIPQTDAPGDDDAEYDGPTTSVLAMIPFLTPGDCVALGFDVRVEFAAPVGSEIRNIARGEPNGGLGPVIWSNEDLLLVSRIDLIVSKTGEDVNGEPLHQDELILYTITACNDPSSTGPAIEVLVRDIIPDDTLYELETITLDGSPLTDAEGDDEGEYSDIVLPQVRVMVPSISLGDCAVVTFMVRTDPPGDTTILNTATASSDGGTGPEFPSDEVSMPLTYLVTDSMMLRGESLRRDVPAVESCPDAAEQSPRLDEVLDECPPGTCWEEIADTAWRLIGDNQPGVGDLIFYEVTNVTCDLVLAISRTAGNANDLFADIQ